MENKKHFPEYARGGFLTIEDILQRKEELFPEHYTFVIKDIYKDGISLKIEEKHNYKSSFDLHLGDEVVKSNATEPISLKKNNGIITIEPGEFALLHSYEKIHIPQDLMAFISLRFSTKKKGLINISGFHVDPGYNGYLIFSVYNVGSKPICLRYQEPIFMIFFATLTKPVSGEYGPGCKQEFKADDIELLKGPALTLINLNERLEKVEGQLKIMIGLFIATLASAILAIITLK
jgi:dCTP deaminase